MLSHIPLPDDEKLVFLPGVALVLLELAKVQIIFGFKTVFLAYILVLAFLYQSRKILRSKEDFIEGENISEEARSLYNPDVDENTRIILLSFYLVAGIFTVLEIYMAYILFSNIGQFTRLSLLIPAYGTLLGLLLHLFSDLSVISFILAIAFKDDSELSEWKQTRDELLPFFNSKNE